LNLKYKLLQLYTCNETLNIYCSAPSKSIRNIRTYEQLDVLISNIHETSYSVQKLSNHGTNLASNTKTYALTKP